MINNLKKHPFMLYSVLIYPFVFIYMWLYTLSMNTALDRQNYIRIMDVDIESRVEPLLPFLAYLLEFITTNNTAKLIIIQFLFISMLVVSIYKYIKPNNVSSFFKCVIALMLCIALDSHALGVQLRMGYAVILFIFLLVSLKKINIFIFIPILMHYGTVFGVLFLIYIKKFKITTDKKFTIHSIFMLFFLTILFKNIEFVFEIIGVRNYYYVYLDKERSFGRAIPYSIVLYVCLVTYILIAIKDRSFYRYFSLSGLWLVYVGFALDFYLAFKMLSPMSMFTTLYLVKYMPRDRNSIVKLLIIFILIPSAFYSYAYQVKII